MIRPLRLAIVLALPLTPSATASAQFAGGMSSVSANGTAVIERPAETLRMEVELSAKGKDVKDALAKLKQRRKSAEEQLAKLGADTESIRFGPPQVNSGENGQQRQMQVMMQQRMMQRRGSRRSSQKPAVKPPVTVSMSLVAQWKLKPVDPEQMLIASHELEEKIKEVDLAGRKAAEELTPEEQELAEEMEDGSQQVFYGGQEQPQPGEPRFVYVAKISDEDRAKACAEAFQRAKADAQRLTTAAHATLGELQQLSDVSQSGVDPEAYEAWGNYQYQMVQRAQQQTANEQIEAIGPRPGTLKYHVTVTASFTLK
ncbi:MAG TPA: SIMPL domain-containing protein [Pirellulales bacterium]|nr:SIMPL domain-containing protein [Pirellulales bacterium]